MAHESGTVASTNLTRTETGQRSADITLYTYDIDLDLGRATDPEATGFPTRTSVTFSSRGTETFLDFTGEAVHAVTTNGQPVDAHDAWDGARIRLSGLSTESPNTVVVEATGAYSRTGQGLHRFVDPADGATYLYTHLEPTDARRVFACFEQPDLKARTTLHVTAPADWQVVANQRLAYAEPVAEGLSRRTFHPTPPLSTYLTALCAGPYVGATSTWSDPRHPDQPEVPLGVWCRASLAEHLDAEAIMATTAAGLDFFHERFAFPYPWGGYDQVFVPEYNIGAMENPGCVTFNEHYLHRSSPTRAERAALANTLLHEMAHMWFGDLVTPTWWDDTWLKESFAEYMGAAASVGTGAEPDAWVSFAGARKDWAYVADQMPTTHPIAADIPDLQAARQNFDGITYAKGAAVLKQLVAYVGPEAFFAGARDYFAAHAFGSARLDDLLGALAHASGRDLGAWAADWLHTCGVDALHVELAPDGARLVRTAPDATRRAHRVAVGVYRPDAEGNLRRTSRVELDLTGDGAALDGLDVPYDADGQLVEGTLVLPNDDDLTYATVRLDPVSRQTALDAVSTITQPLAQAQVWSALWNDVRDARLDAPGYVDLVVAHGGLPAGEGSLVLPRAIAHALEALAAYVPAEVRTEVAEGAFEVVWQRLVDAPAGSDEQVAWARAACGFAAAVGEDLREDAITRLGMLLDGPVPDGLDVGPDLRWKVVRALAAQGAMEDLELEAEAERDPSAHGLVHLLAAWVGRPEPEAKQQAWDRLLADPPRWSNEEIDAAVDGFTVPAHRAMTTAYAPAYWQQVDRVWQRLPQEIATRLVGGLFPSADIEVGDDPDRDPDVLRDAQSWLDAHPAAPGALRRLIVERLDAARRAVAAQRLVLASLELEEDVADEDVADEDPADGEWDDPEAIPQS